MPSVCGLRLFFTSHYVYAFFWWNFCTVHIGQRNFDLYAPAIRRATREQYIAILNGSK
jgi:hypothetical protein